MTPAVRFPDATATVIAVLTAPLAPLKVTGAVPSPRPAEFVRVERVGGPRRSVVVDAPMLTVECWAATGQKADALAARARTAVFAAANTVVAGVTVHRVTEVGGPVSLPDPISDQPRVTFTVAALLRGGAP